MPEVWRKGSLIMNYKYLIISVVALLVLAGCRKATVLTSDTKSVTAPKQGAADTVILHSDVCAFELVDAPDWAGAALTDSVLSLKIQANGTGAPRSGNVIVRNGELTLSIPVEQRAAATYLTIKEPAKGVVTIPRDGGEAKITVDTDGGDVRLEGVDGVTAKYADGVVTLTGKGNTGKTRKTKARLVADEVSAPLTVIEAGAICFRCNGKGRVTCYICHGEGVDYCPYRPCDICRGSGTVRCPECGGKGK